MATVYYGVMMISKHVKQLYNAYGYTEVKLLPPQKGYRNESHPCVTATGERLNVILYKDEPHILQTIKNANAVTDALFAEGLPVRHSASSKIIQIKTAHSMRYAALYHYLPGSTIAWDMYSMEHIKALGERMSTMHAVLSHKTFKNLLHVSDEYLKITERMQEYFSQTGVQTALHSKLHLQLDPHMFENYIKLLRIASRFPHQQPLHMDFVRGNILFDGKKVSGILDFEKVAWGHPVFDIARTLAFLLVDCKYKTADKVHKYFLISGYNKRGAAHFSPMKLHGKDVLEELTTLFLLYDLYKFLRHNPYESLPKNEHFVLTCKLLQSRAIINHEIK